MVEEKLLIVLIMWGALAFITVLLVLCSKKFSIDKKITNNFLEILKYVTFSTIGYALGVGISNG